MVVTSLCFVGFGSNFPSWAAILELLLLVPSAHVGVGLLFAVGNLSTLKMNATPLGRQDSSLARAQGGGVMTVASGPGFLCFWRGHAESLGHFVLRSP